MRLVHMDRVGLEPTASRLQDGRASVAPPAHRCPRTLLSRTLLPNVRKCNGRESNPRFLDGDEVYFHYTTDAYRCGPDSNRRDPFRNQRFSEPPPLPLGHHSMLARGAGFAPALRGPTHAVHPPQPRGRCCVLLASMSSLRSLIFGAPAEILRIGRTSARAHPSDGQARGAGFEPAWCLRPPAVRFRANSLLSPRFKTAAFPFWASPAWCSCWESNPDLEVEGLG
jgi:hypothetical protein